MNLKRIYTWLTFLPMILVLPCAGASLAGTWKLDSASSSSIKPWTEESLTIRVDGDLISLDRALRWDNDRHYQDKTECIADGKTVTKNAVQFWVDTWYNNCYIGSDHSKKVSATWISKDGAKLSTKTDLRLEAQQGEFPVQIEDEYSLSSDGASLLLTERRSTRDQVLHFIFKRQ